MKKRRLKASYTIEAAIYIPIIMFLMLQTLQLAIDFWQQSRDREVSEVLKELDVVKEFYSYQVLEELGKEILDD